MRLLMKLLGWAKLGCNQHLRLKLLSALGGNELVHDSFVYNYFHLLQYLQLPIDIYLRLLRLSKWGKIYIEPFLVQLYRMVFQ